MPFSSCEPKPKKLSPSPEECFRKAAELAPDDLSVNQSLLRFYRQQEQAARGIKVAGALKHHPGHVETLETQQQTAHGG
jgi:hypothetical protein